jgi:hypothetical protein
VLLLGRSIGVVRAELPLEVVPGLVSWRFFNTRGAAKPL